MSNRVQWEPRHSVGDELLDDQHRRILDQCHALTDFCRDDDAEHDRQFRVLFDELMALAHAHFAAEEAQLIANNYAALDDYRHEIEEFDYLVAEIVTPENFDKIELQRFLALWWVGHIVSATKQFPEFVKK